MRLHDDQLPGLDDYAPAPKKRKISRGRKALIAFMAIGTFAATSGAGTFASFTASTDNPGGQQGDGDNPFQTPDLELTNTVLARSYGATGLNTDCVSSADVDPGVVASWDLDATDNTSYCQVLFEADPSFATTATADVQLENTGRSDGDLVFYAGNVQKYGDASDVASGTPINCVIDGTITFAGHQELCGDWTLQIQEYANGGTPLTGDNTDVNTMTARADQCAYPKDLAAACGANTGLFNALPLFGTAVTGTTGRTTVGSLPAATAKASPNLDADSRFFRVTATLTKDAACTGNDANNDGLHDTTGIGCYNGSMNGSAVILLRWVLQG